MLPALKVIFIVPHFLSFSSSCFSKGLLRGSQRFYAPIADCCNVEKIFLAACAKGTCMGLASFLTSISKYRSERYTPTAYVK